MLVAPEFSARVAFFASRRYTTNLFQSSLGGNHVRVRADISPRQLAEAIGVSESSVKRWCDDGELAASRTAGGHRRLPIPGVVEFLRRTGRPVQKPNLLGLPAVCGASKSPLSHFVENISHALIAGDEAAPCAR